MVNKDYMFSFEKLNVWKLAKELIIEVYKSTSNFPTNVKYALISQINRAVVSIPTNIAEGLGRNRPKDQAKFYTVAFSSLLELLSLLFVANELNLIDD